MNLEELWRRGKRFLLHDIWHLPEQVPDRRQSYLLRLLRIVVLAARGFATDSLQLRASALTYYSLLSLVPAVALAFGIAKGFGLEAAMEAALTEQLAGQQQVLDQVIGFSRSLLANTKGGVVAGAGVAVLLWSVFRLLGNIENSFNAIWSVERGRTLVRQLTDYLAIAILAPLLMLSSSSATVIISSKVNSAVSSVGLLEPVSGMVQHGLGLLPFAFVWISLTLVYLAMPNTSVSWRAGLTAGVVAGTLYQIVQFGYIQFVVNVARYNAIYGSFAALPLFLIWLHLSWLIVLVGAEVAFAVDNAGDYARERAVSVASHHQRRLLAVRLAVACAARFLGGEKPARAADLAAELDVPLRLVSAALNALVHGDVLVEVRGDDRRALAYQPAGDPALTSLVDVMHAYDQLGGEAIDRSTLPDAGRDLLPAESLGEVATRWQALDDLVTAAADNVTIAELAGSMKSPAKPAST